MSDGNLKRPKGSSKKKIIVGRGAGGKRSLRAGRGNKGQNSRSGGGVRPGFEGGQMPLYRRLPRKGFSNSRFKTSFHIVNVGQIAGKFSDGEVVDTGSLRGKKLVKGDRRPVKVLGDGAIAIKVTVKVDAISSSARKKIEAAGGIIKTPAGSSGASEEEKVTADGE